MASSASSGDEAKRAATLENAVTTPKRSTTTNEVGIQCDAPQEDIVAKLEKEKAELQRRLELVEELVGPTETQRKLLQEQVVAARSSALRAKYRGAGLPTKVAGRLDDNLLWSCGLSERDAGLLQGGCLPNKEGILQDVSLLGDPAFRPYDEQTGELRWHARGGMLQLSLGEVRNRFGDDVAHDVVRCAKELDKWDSSRRVGVELPWHPLEERELEPSEVIELMDRELSLQSSILYADEREAGQPYFANGHSDNQDSHTSPYAVVNSQPRRGRGRRIRQARSNCEGRIYTGARGSGNSRSGAGSSAVVSLPRVSSETTRRAPDARCALPNHLRHRMQESLDQSLLACNDRIRLF